MEFSCVDNPCTYSQTNNKIRISNISSINLWWNRSMVIFTEFLVLDPMMYVVHLSWILNQFAHDVPVICTMSTTVYIRSKETFLTNAQWLATVLGRHFWFPIPLGIYSICLYSPKSFVEFDICVKKAISGSYGLENSQTFLKKPRISKNLKVC